MKIEFNNLEELLAFCREVEEKRETIWDEGWAEAIECEQEQIEELKTEIAGLEEANFHLKNKLKQKSVAK